MNGDLIPGMITSAVTLLFLAGVTFYGAVVAPEVGARLVCLLVALNASWAFAANVRVLLDA